MQLGMGGAGFCGEECVKFLHARLAITTVGMHRRIIEKNPVTTAFQLRPYHESFISPPVGIIHAGGLVGSAVPGSQRVAGLVQLPPLRRRGVKLRAEWR